MSACPEIRTLAVNVWTAALELADALDSTDAYIRLGDAVSMASQQLREMKQAEEQAT